MRTLAKLALVGAVIGTVARVLARRRHRDLDFAEPHTHHPERVVEAMEAETDIPGGVHP